MYTPRTAHSVTTTTRNGPEDRSTHTTARQSYPARGAQQVPQAGTLRRGDDSPS